MHLRAKVLPRSIDELKNHPQEIITGIVLVTFLVFAVCGFVIIYIKKKKTGKDPFASCRPYFSWLSRDKVDDIEKGTATNTQAFRFGPGKHYGGPPENATSSAPASFPNVSIRHPEAAKLRNSHTGMSPTIHQTTPDSLSYLQGHPATDNDSNNILNVVSELGREDEGEATRLPRRFTLNWVDIFSKAPTWCQSQISMQMYSFDEDEVYILS
ncbi:hypothetical protein P280DRAFT_480894 [Massarina eburnea CBS 473.64]|uniref:Uncharacterized protein n=1 Tax=Massarina eburnea CBS 473.64 TaxID=1395130 RepID=A0A6A6RZ02_9PLEO|nr:hypothetical protein P280DRAFT_480894 [Massarina eburnea CBS 473.64]